MDRYPSTSYPEVRFWCLQTLTDAFKTSGVLQMLSDDDASFLQRTLLSWVAEAVQRADPPVPPFVKNKLAPPFRDAEFDIMFDEGISTSGDLLDLAVADEIVKKSGAWFSYGEMRLGQGRENSKSYLIENPEIMVQMAEKVRQQSGVVDAVEAPAFTEEDEEPSDLE